MKVKGRDLITGLPKMITINQNEIVQALQSDVDKILESTKSVLEETPPELSSDIVENGIILTGGGALLLGMEELFSKTLKVPVRLANNPLTSVCEGTGIMLDNMKLL